MPSPDHDVSRRGGDVGPLDRYRLVALTRLWVLLVHARDLFVEATDQRSSPLIIQRQQRTFGLSGRACPQGDAPDFVEVGEAGIAMDDAMRRQRRVQLVG